MTNQIANKLSEQGLVPDALIRHGIRNLLRQRLEEIGASDIASASKNTRHIVAGMQDSQIAELPHKANEQHYEVPSQFFRYTLGRHLKYSCAYWADGVESLNEAETRALEVTCERAQLSDGMDILELGCGWGSLSLYMAKRYPGSRIVALSNSRSQGEYIRNTARARQYDNLEVLTEDMNRFTSSARFDRIVSVEMFEHMRNWQSLFERVSNWLHADGQFFMHIFAHRNAPYYFEDRDANDWMSRHFFSGGMMPSLDLPLFIQNHLAIRERWIWDGRHYEKTCNAWLNNMDRNKDELWPLIENTYGRDFAKIWWMRWRMFFMACAELFGYQNGQEWMVAHYLFDKQAKI